MSGANILYRVSNPWQYVRCNTQQIAKDQGSICNNQLKSQEIVNTNNMQDAICNEIARNSKHKTRIKDQYPITNWNRKKFQISNAKRSKNGGGGLRYGNYILM